MLGPAITEHTGGFRLLILSLEDPPKPLQAALRKVHTNPPSWTISPPLHGTFPQSATPFSLGGKLPHLASLNDPDYLPSTIASFLLPLEASKSTASTAIYNSIIATLSPTTSPQRPDWFYSTTVNTINGKVQLYLFPTPAGLLSPADRHILTDIQVGSLSATCLSIFLRADVAYYFHLPIEKVKFYSKMPFQGFSSPSQIAMSSHLGAPPIPSLYLLSLPDMACYATHYLDPVTQLNLVSKPTSPPPASLTNNSDVTAEKIAHVANPRPSKTPRGTGAPLLEPPVPASSKTFMTASEEFTYLHGKISLLATRLTVLESQIQPYLHLFPAIPTLLPTRSTGNHNPDASLHSLGQLEISSTRTSSRNKRKPSTETPNNTNTGSDTMDVANADDDD